MRLNVEGSWQALHTPCQWGYMWFYCDQGGIFAFSDASTRVDWLTKVIGSGGMAGLPHVRCLVVAGEIPIMYGL